MIDPYQIIKNLQKELLDQKAMILTLADCHNTLNAKMHQLFKITEEQAKVLEQTIENLDRLVTIAKSKNDTQ